MQLGSKKKIWTQSQNVVHVRFYCTQVYLCGVCGRWTPLAGGVDPSWRQSIKLSQGHACLTLGTRGNGYEIPNVLYLLWLAFRVNGMDWRKIFKALNLFAQQDNLYAICIQKGDINFQSVLLTQVLIYLKRVITLRKRSDHSRKSSNPEFSNTKN